MLTRTASAVVAAVALFALPPASADEFEDGPGDDSAATTTNELNIDQEHDLEAVGGVADEDWFIIFSNHRRSYEVRVFSESGEPDFTATTTVTRTSADGNTVLQTNPVGSRSFAVLRWMNNTDTNAVQRVRVSTGQTTLTSRSKYVIQLRETTLYCPRYNNSGTQTSVLILQQARATTATCNVEAYFYNQDTGTIAGVSQNTLAQNNMLVISGAAVTGVPGTRGHVRVAHTCGNQALRGKLVALEPSTGFSFDTPCEQR